MGGRSLWYWAESYIAVCISRLKLKWKDEAPSTGKDSKSGVLKLYEDKFKIELTVKLQRASSLLIQLSALLDKNVLQYGRELQDLE